MRLALVFYAGLFAVAWLWRTALGGESLLYADAEAAAAGVRPLRDLAVGLAAGLALVAASRVWTRLSRRGAELADALGQLLGPLSGGAVLALAVASGIAEEAFFRGALQPRVGLWVASGLFGLAHFVPRHGFAAWAPAAILAGLALGELYRSTGNLIAPALAHGLINALNLRWLSSRRPH